MADKPRRTENVGTLGVNKYKKKDWHPPYSGMCKITCKDCGVVHEFYISGYLGNGKFYNLYFKEKVPKEGGSPGQQPAAASTPPPEQNFESRKNKKDDDIY